MPDPHPRHNGNRSFTEIHGPHSPSNSDSPLSLVVRKDEDRCRGHRNKGHGHSPGRSSGFSDGGYGSSPNRSPHQDLPYDTSPPISVKLIYQDTQDNENEKPLSLVIRKNLSHFRDPNFNIPEYTVHSKEQTEPQYKLSERDSGTEDSDLTPPNSVPPSHHTPPPSHCTPPPSHEASSHFNSSQSHQHGVPQSQHIISPSDYSHHHVAPQPPSHHTLPIPIPPTISLQSHPRTSDHQLSRIQLISQVEDEDRDRLVIEEKPSHITIVPNITLSAVSRRDSIVDGENEESEKDDKSTKTAGIKIKDFAKLLENEEVAGGSPKSPRKPSCDNNTPKLDVEEFSDVSSECPSVSSVDTWSSSMMEGKPYSYGSDLVIRRVSRSSNGEAMYQCDFCDKLFANKYHLQSHLVTHTGERAFNCRICKKTFGRKSTLRAHMTTHTKKSNFMCPVCEKACNDNNSLEEHMRMHTGEKPFICTICSKAYARKSHLNVHYRVHTGERPFICHHCDKDFTEKRFLNDHLQTAHNGIDGPLKCPNCAREFAYKTSLKQHLKKQMCERNMNRGTSSSLAGAVSKQFQCPFCEKSYSWKQTLKQHVSMYHRNKIHTDEFWRYELTKNRRAVMDDKANDDLWHKQLGKHGEEVVKKIKVEGDQGTSVHGETSPSVDSKWLEQIKQMPVPPNDANSSNTGGVSTEIKLLALQSLQNSLHFMSMGMTAQQLSSLSPAQQLATMAPFHRLANLQTATNQESAPTATTLLKEDAVNPPQQDSYLSLLAKIAKKECEEREEKTKKKVIVDEPLTHDSQGPTRLPAKETESTAEQDNNDSQDNGLPMLPIKEESPTKRTQMWLNQVNKYRHRLPKEELDANHEQLWEEQISRVRKNPVRSPLEPVEIVIEDDSDSNRSRNASPCLPAPILPIDQQETALSVLQSKLLMNQTAAPPPSMISQAGSASPRPEFPLPRSLGGPPTTKQVKLPTKGFHRDISPLARNPTGSPPRRSTISINSPEPVRATPPGTPGPPLSKEKTTFDLPSADGSSSVLKSLLLERTNRKRSSPGDNSQQEEPKKSPGPAIICTKQPRPEQPRITEDILRKRLLGWVDPPPACDEPVSPAKTAADPAQGSQEPIEPVEPIEEAGSAASVDPHNAPIQDHSYNNVSNVNHQSGESQVNNNDNSREENDNNDNGERRYNTLSYANTSVLKHLLYRYTGTPQ